MALPLIESVQQMDPECDKWRLLLLLESELIWSNPVFMPFQRSIIQETLPSRWKEILALRKGGVNPRSIIRRVRGSLIARRIRDPGGFSVSMDGQENTAKDI